MSSPVAWLNVQALQGAVIEAWYCSHNTMHLSAVAAQGDGLPGAPLKIRLPPFTPFPTTKLDEEATIWMG